MNVVKLNPIYAPDYTKNKAIGLGSLYIGLIDTDPTIEANRKTIYILNEDSTKTAISQPVSLGAGGVPLYNGSPVTLITDGNYSLTVLSSSGAQVYYIPSNEDFNNSTEPLATLAELQAYTGDLTTVFVEGRTSAGDGYQGYFQLVSGDYSAEVTADTTSAIFVAKSGLATTSGCWKRVGIEEGVNLLWFGIVGGGADDNAAIHAWADFCYLYSLEGYAPAGHYYYSVGLTFDTAEQRLWIRGAGAMNLNDYNSGNFLGTVFECTSATDTSITLGDGVTTTNQNFRISDMAFIGNTSGLIFDAQYIASSNKINNLFLVQKGSGDGMLLADMWTSDIRNILVVNKSGGNTGTGFKYYNPTASGAGLVTLWNITVEDFNLQIQLGGSQLGGDNNVQKINAFMQAHGGNYGADIGNIKNSDIQIWFDGTIANYAARCFDGCDGNFLDLRTGTNGCATADVILGKSGASATENWHANNTYKLRLAGVTAKGVSIYSTSSSVNETIYQPVMTAASAGVGTAISMENGVASYRGLSIIRPSFTNFATDISHADYVNLLQYGNEGAFLLRRTYFDGFAKGTTTASNTTMTLPEDGNYYVVTGTTDINTINAPSTGSGLIILKFNGSLSLLDSTGGTGTGNLVLGGGDVAVTLNDLVMLYYDSAVGWLQVAPASAN